MKENKLVTIQDVLDGKNQCSTVLGDAETTLSKIRANIVDCVITSPPYWQQRDYVVSAEYQQMVIGNESNLNDYIQSLVNVFKQIQRVLKPGGSLWINLGDKYANKNLLGIPWKVAFALQNENWILRNDIVWEKLKGAQPVKDRLRNNYEHIFHFVKTEKYYYDSDTIRIKPRLSPDLSNGKTVSATGVSGLKYRQQIKEATLLTESQKKAALEALENVLQKIRDGEVIDFRMTIKGYQRTLHGSKEKYSGRAKELEQKGFYILQSYAKGYVPSDIWRLVPEDEVKARNSEHYAVFPIELLKIPVLATCPENGIVLDPFMGVGSTLLAALKFNRRCIGIDISEEYVQAANRRIAMSNMNLPNVQPA
jgi:DNA modification methylase